MVLTGLEVGERDGHSIRNGTTAFPLSGWRGKWLRKRAERNGRWDLRLSLPALGHCVFWTTPTLLSSLLGDDVKWKRHRLAAAEF